MDDNRAVPADGWLVGAYAAAPSRNGWDPDLESHFFDALANLPGVTGFELPFADTLHKFDEPWLFDQLPRDTSVVVTTAPGTSQRVRSTGTFGIASTDTDGRRAALEHTEAARQSIHRLNQALGRLAVVAIELHAAPKHLNGASSPDALQQSLEELVTWDWGGARVVIEHCDAQLPGQASEKGYFELDAEIETILDVNRSTGATIGLAINWGRSVIERRDPDAARQHVERLREADLLAGIIFSGCSPAATAFGGSWADVHLPPAAPNVIADDAELADLLEPTSLMTAQRIADTLESAGPESAGRYRGIKVAARPEASVSERIATISQSLTLVRAAAALARG
ncbi:DUF4862 family protein [Diaminobutyricimonas sp. TR449]|uniref:DUF4862 family protein n=1 Tax=Diaminobutyricimonas sp. TR449 TaxID=2708076 RepID=UPI0014204982|nr:DUF4862 family protein [Diaminobutyricimonas sp. TR449]